MKIREYLNSQVREYLESVPPNITSDVYALSMYISDECDLELQNVELSVGVHTESQVIARLNRARNQTDEFEARWSFLVWSDPHEPFVWGKQNYKTVLGEDRDLDPVGLEYREEWLRESGLWGLEADDFDDYEEYFEVVHNAKEAFWSLIGEVGLEQRRSGLIARIFGDRRILIAVHRVASNLDNSATRIANPDGEVEFFGLARE